MDPMGQLNSRLQHGLSLAYQVLEARLTSAPARLTLKALRPRLERSLAAEPARMAALLTWAWARIPELLGDAVDLSDQARVVAIVEMVEQHEFGAGAAAADAPDPELEAALAAGHPGGADAAANGEPI